LRLRRAGPLRCRCAGLVRWVAPAAGQVRCAGLWVR